MRATGSKVTATNQCISLEYEHSQNQIYQYLHFGVNHEQEDHSVLLGSSVLLCNLSSTSMHVQQWQSGKNLCVMEGYCGRQCRQYIRLLWRSELERLGIIHFIFIILTVGESHAARVWVSLKRALMCVR